MDERALLWGIVVWAVVFAALYALFFFVVDLLGPFGPFGLLILPQIISSVAGAHVFVTRRRRLTKAGRAGALFAAAACAAALLVSFLRFWIPDPDRQSGLKGVGVFLLVYFWYLLIDGLLAAILGKWIGEAAERRRASQ